MLISNSFEVPLPPEDAWNVLMDIPRIARCMPGAELTGAVDDNTYNGNVSVRLGPVALTFAGTVKFTEKESVSHRARVNAQGRDAKGRGGAHAKVDFQIEPAPEGSRVLVQTDLTLSGAVAQYGRASGMIQDVAQQLIGKFANALKVQLLESQRLAPAGGAATVPGDAATPVQSAPPPQPARPQAISGFALFGMLIASFFRRLTGSSKA